MPVTKVQVPKEKVEASHPKNILETVAAKVIDPIKRAENQIKGWGLGGASSASTATSRVPYSEFSMKFQLDDYEFPEDETLDPMNTSTKVQLDVTALDRYNEDVRKYRRHLLEECRLIPLRGEVDPALLDRVRVAANNLCRSCYYGTYKAHSLAESSVVILIWLLSRKNFPIQFQIKILQSLTEMIWTSNVLKVALAKAQGVRILVRMMKSGMLHHESLACWAGYALVTSAIGSGKVIEAARSLPNIEEYVGEMAFQYYWRNWPANFGSILQGVLFGPNAVVPLEEEYQFM